MESHRLTESNPSWSSLADPFTRSRARCPQRYQQLRHRRVSPTVTGTLEARIADWHPPRRRAQAAGATVVRCGVPRGKCQEGDVGTSGSEPPPPRQIGESSDINIYRTDRCKALGKSSFVFF